MTDLNNIMYFWMRVFLFCLSFHYASGVVICNCQATSAALSCNVYCNMVGFDTCCTSGGNAGRRNIEDWDIDERQASGETPIPGTNLTVGEVRDSFVNMRGRLDILEVSIEFEPAQSEALAECFESGLCA